MANVESLTAISAYTPNKNAFMSITMCDDVLFRYGNKSAFLKSASKTAKLLHSAYIADPITIIAVIDNRSFPYTVECASLLKEYLRCGGKFSRTIRYSNYYNFCLSMSRWKYAPSKSIYELVPSTVPSDREKEFVAITFPMGEPTSIKKVGPGVFFMNDSQNEMYVVQISGISRAYKQTALLVIAHYVLRWASSVENFSRRLKITPLVPPRGIAADIARTLATASQSTVDYEFYHKFLLLETVKHMGSLVGIISTSYGEVNSHHTSDNGDVCIICMSGLHNGNALSLPCNHEFHTTCIYRWYHNCRECPICRIALVLPNSHNLQTAIYA